MALRKQTKGGQRRWSLDEILAGLREFYKEHNRYPTTPEIDRYPYLPSARSLERSFGGAVALRKQFNLPGQDDFRTGEHSSLRAKAITKRAHQVEDTVYKLLTDRFGIEFVHREYFFTDDKRTRADFLVYDKMGNFCVDVFYPSDRRNLSGCLNSKLLKYHAPHMQQYPVIFLQMNSAIEDSVLDQLVKSKKQQLRAHERLMSWNSFVEFTKQRKPLKIR